MFPALTLSRQAGRVIKTLHPRQYKQVVATVLTLLNNPAPHGSRLLNGSRRDNRGVDVGEYRVVYRVEGEHLFVLALGQRGDDDVCKFPDGI